VTGYFPDDDGKLDYPSAERLVAAYLAAHSGRQRTTSVDVLRWSDDYQNSHHNRQRVYETLGRAGEETAVNWSGRTVFRLPDDP
jgi:hypothetical protein